MEYAVNTGNLVLKALIWSAQPKVFSIAKLALLVGRRAEQLADSCETYVRYR